MYMQVTCLWNSMYVSFPPYVCMYMTVRYTHLSLAVCMQVDHVYLCLDSEGGREERGSGGL